MCIGVFQAYEYVDQPSHGVAGVHVLSAQPVSPQRAHNSFHSRVKGHAARSVFSRPATRVSRLTPSVFCRSQNCIAAMKLCASGPYSRLKDRRRCAIAALSNACAALTCSDVVAEASACSAAWSCSRFMWPAFRLFRLFCFPGCKSIREPIELCAKDTNTALTVNDKGFVGFVRQKNSRHLLQALE